MDRVDLDQEVMDTPVHGVHGPHRIRPSSYRALRSAVCSLARIDDFVCEKIGSGFFSEVFKVQHRITGQVMALKMNTMASNRANMLKEVQLMNRLNHPNILRFVGVCVHEGHLHALTEYINGGNLEQLLDSDVYLSWAVRMSLALDIARGLQYLHSKGIFHRDLTSKNCLVRWENGVCSAVVGDFGLAEKIPEYSDGSQKQPLAVVGSPYWMAPEVLRGELYNEKVDVFAYGIILCEIIGRIQADPDFLPRTEDFGLDVEAFRQMVGDCPSAFFNLAIVCCSMRPEDRPAFSDVVAELEKREKERIEKEREQESAVRGAVSPSIPPLRRQSLGVLGDPRLCRSKSDVLPPPPAAPANQTTPARVNPFSQREDLKGGRIKLFDTPSKSVISLTFTLPPPPNARDHPPCEKIPLRLHRRCQSLPCTPEIIQSLHSRERNEPDTREHSGKETLVNDETDASVRTNPAGVSRTDVCVNTTADDETGSRCQNTTETHTQHVTDEHDEQSTRARSPNVAEIENVSVTDVHLDIVDVFDQNILETRDISTDAHTDDKTRPGTREEGTEEQGVDRAVPEEEEDADEETKEVEILADDSGLPLDLELFSLDRVTEESLAEPMDCTDSPSTPDGAVPSLEKPFSNGWSPPISNGPPSLPPLPHLDNNNTPAVVSRPLGWSTNGYHTAGTLTPPQETDEVISCPGCCLAGLSFPSVCVRAPQRNPYKNLNGDSATRGLLCRAQPPSPSEPAVALPGTRT